MWSSGIRWGGKVAQLAASRNLEGLAGVVLVAPAPLRPTVDTDAAQRRSRAYASSASISDALERVLTYRPLAAGLRQQVITDSLAGNPDALLAWPRHGITENITGPPVSSRFRSKSWPDATTAEVSSPGVCRACRRHG
jgi:pimeloyl-ACP methyl ester carboxylesterase